VKKKKQKPKQKPKKKKIEKAKGEQELTVSTLIKPSKSKRNMNNETTCSWLTPALQDEGDLKAYHQLTIQMLIKPKSNTKRSMMNIRQIRMRDDLKPIVIRPENIITCFSSNSGPTVVRPCRLKISSTCSSSMCQTPPAVSGTSQSVDSPFQRAPMQ
jgi:hypothetical protein